VFNISVRIPKVVRSIGVRSSGMWICGAGVLESWRLEMRLGWYSGHEAGTENVAGAGLSHESKNRLRTKQARGSRNRGSDIGFSGLARMHVRNSILPFSS